MNTDYTDTIAEVLEGCITAIWCQRDKYYPDKNFGSKIRGAQKMSPDELLAYSRQALAGFEGVFVKGASLSDGNAVFDILINNEKGQVIISL